MNEALQKRVLLIARTVQHYRVPFHEQVREYLAAHGVDFQIVQGVPQKIDCLKGDTVDLPWAETIPNQNIGTLIWQPLLARARHADLIIVGQENKLLLNYILQTGRRRFFGRVALWGHGRNFQARNPLGASERWKRFWATRCDWWFGYTEETRRHLLSLGFPSERITVFNNAVDTTELQATAAALTTAEITATRAAIGVTSDNMAIFVGGLYSDKRIDFLVRAADYVRGLVPDFQLLVVGGGEDRPKLEDHAATRPWLIIAGPRFGREKAALMLSAKLFLMPGLVGLAVLDAAALGLPLVTTNYPFHSPEIVYLKDGMNGVIVPDWLDSNLYGHTVAGLMLDGPRRAKMAEASRATASQYSIEMMSRRFGDGILSALSSS